MQVSYGAIGTAIIAGSFSVFTIILAREQKVSEFRRIWLDEIRAEIASFLAYANLFSTYYKTSKDDLEIAEILLDIRSELIAMNNVASRLRLRLQEDEPLEARLLFQIQSIQKRINSFVEISAGDLAMQEESLIRDSNVLMAERWRKVKSGETVYIIIKFSVSFLFGLIVIVLGFMIASG